MSMHIVLMNVKEPLKTVHRQPTEIMRFENVTFLEPTDVLRPDLIIGGVSDIADFINVNYVSIPRLGRYYFVTSYEMMTGGLVKLHCFIDVEYSFRKDIDSMKKNIISRQANERDLYLADSMLPISAKRSTKSYTLPDMGFDNNTNDSDKSGYFLILSTSGLGDSASVERNDE